MENLSIYCRIWNVSEYIREVLKQVRVTLCKTDVMHHHNKLLVCSNSKFDELKEFHLVRIKKKRTIFCNVWNFFSNGE